MATQTVSSEQVTPPSKSWLKFRRPNRLWFRGAVFRAVLLVLADPDSLIPSRNIPCNLYRLLEPFGNSSPMGELWASIDAKDQTLTANQEHG